MPTSPFSIANIRLFIAFRVFFNARLYYPVFTIVFLDYGLTIEQFALLNVAWAATIVFTEVPSGALADILGRKTLLVTTAMLMLFEMALLCFVPLKNMNLVFSAFLINRILSGLAEAMASGADEAIAYDSLVEHGLEDKWPQVLSVQMRISSVASVLSMAAGALIYDPDMVNKLFGILSFQSEFTQLETMRFPLYATFLLAICAVCTALKMQETKINKKEHTVQNKDNIRSSLLMIVSAARWIIASPFALCVILFGMCYDHSTRMIVTMTSQYYRLIDLPEASFGIIGGAIGLLGLIVPKVAEKMATRYSPIINCVIIGLIGMTGIIGITFFLPWYGILPMALIFVALMLTSFFTSHYLNKFAPSHQRATILSFKGLAFNIGYGFIGVLFAGLIHKLRHQTIVTSPDMTEIAIQDQAFIDGIGFFPAYTFLLITGAVVISIFLMRNNDLHKQI